MITPAQYWISGGRLGGGFADSSSDELCLYVNRSTSANTFVIRGGETIVAADVGAEFAPDDADGAEATAAGVARSFSFPRPVAVLNAFMNGLTSRPAPAELVPLDAPEPPVLLEEPEDGCDDDPARTSKFIEATAGWKLVRGL